MTRFPRVTLVTVVITANHRPGISCNTKTSMGLQLIIKNKHTANQTTVAWSQEQMCQFISISAKRIQDNIVYTWAIFPMMNFPVGLQLEEVSFASSRSKPVLMSAILPSQSNELTPSNFCSLGKKKSQPSRNWYISISRNVCNCSHINSNKNNATIRYNISIQDFMQILYH